MRLAVLGIGIGLLLLLAACSGGGDDPERVLVLGRGDVTEAEYRVTVQTFILTDAGAEIFCERLTGLSDREVADVLVQLSRDTGVERVQEPIPGDEERVAAIIKEECDRIG